MPHSSSSSSNRLKLYNYYNEVLFSLLVKNAYDLKGNKYARLQ